jgi:hypothetical protein
MSHRLELVVLLLLLASVSLSAGAGYSTTWLDEQPPQPRPGRMNGLASWKEERRSSRLGLRGRGISDRSAPRGVGLLQGPRSPPHAAVTMPPPGQNGSGWGLNARDFGAKGDGVADDAPARLSHGPWRHSEFQTPLSIIISY